jgi:hypothetical protein
MVDTRPAPQDACQFDGHPSSVRWESVFETDSTAGVWTNIEIFPLYI